MDAARPLPALRSEEQRRRQLVVTRRRATLLLAGVAVVWVIVTFAGYRSGWTGYVQATAEASMVGGLADWFAVTALFRRPLGLPIPHTAIVAERKNQFATTLGQFIEESFLTPEAMVARVQAAAPVSRLASWLADRANASRLAAQVADLAVAGADLLNDDEIRDSIEALVRQRVDAVAVAPLAGRALHRATADGRHVKLVDAALRAVDRSIHDHRHELRGRLAAQSPWWLPDAVEDRIFERLLDGAHAVLQDMVADHGHDLRRELDAAIERFATELETSPELRARGEQLKADLLGQPQLREWSTQLWTDLKRELRTQAVDPDSELRRRLSDALVALGERLARDHVLRSQVVSAVERTASYLADHFHNEIGDLVSGTIARWDASETSRRLELLLGPDLQYIRINGTVVGGGAGLFLYAVSRLA
jgi:uncharacterized membrane-anchored protein YjiN (DUF445 family)